VEEEGWTRPNAPKDLQYATGVDRRGRPSFKVSSEKLEPALLFRCLRAIAADVVMPHHVHEEDRAALVETKCDPVAAVDPRLQER
jgi:hypothetical protein